MFYEYALDPKILADVNRCRTFFEGFEARASRLVSDVPKNWQQLAFQAINQLPHEECKPVLKKTLKEKLKKLLQNNLVKTRAACANTDQLPWEDFVLQQNEIYPFAAIFGLMARAGPAVIHDFSNLLYEQPQCWAGENQKHVERQAASIVDAMVPLLIVSKSVHLVDPHFSFVRPSLNRYEPVLRELVRRLPEFNLGRGINNVSIHTSDRRGSMVHQLTTSIGPWLPQGITIRVNHWPDADMHDRFVLTGVGGLYFGHGLDEFEHGHPEQVLVSTLQHDVYKKELAKVTGNPVIQYELTGCK